MKLQLTNCPNSSHTSGWSLVGFNFRKKNNSNEENTSTSHKGSYMAGPTLKPLRLPISFKLRQITILITSMFSIVCKEFLNNGPKKRNNIWANKSLWEIKKLSNVYMRSQPPVFLNQIRSTLLLEWQMVQLQSGRLVLSTSSWTLASMKDLSHVYHFSRVGNSFQGSAKDKSISTTSSQRKMK